MRIEWPLARKGISNFGEIDSQIKLRIGTKESLRCV